MFIPRAGHQHRARPARPRLSQHHKLRPAPIRTEESESHRDAADSTQQKPSKHWSEHKGSCNLLTESLTLDQLCGGRAGASSSSCWLSERTPHNGDRHKIGRSGESTWTKRYFGRQPIWGKNSEPSRTISIDIARTQVWKDGCRSLVEHRQH